MNASCLVTTPPPPVSSSNDQNLERRFGADELNVCEFPLFALGRERNQTRKTLFFHDRIFDDGAKRFVDRELIITASDHFGLPTAVDSDILLVLLYLTASKTNFQSPHLEFSRYELVKLLGWDDGGKSYRRIDESIHRWVSVTLHYKKSWWNRNDQAWNSKAFSILESIDLKGRSNNGGDLLSTITWNSVVFASFQSNNLKRIDLNTYFQLKSPSARQAYRFLDKRFYRCRHLEFDLRSFACEHVGFSRYYDNGKLKEKLQPCLNELVDIGFLNPASKQQRFVKVRKGEWRIILERANPGNMNRSDQLDRSTAIAETGRSPIQAGLGHIATAGTEIGRAVSGMSRDTNPNALAWELISRGIAREVASQIVESYSEDLIRGKLNLVDQLCKSSSTHPRNKAGFLIAAIRRNFVGQSATPKPRFNPIRTDTNQNRPKPLSSSAQDLESKDLEERYRSLLPEQAEMVWKTAFELAPAFKKQTFLRMQASNSSLTESLRMDIILSHLAKNCSNLL
jgi:hypothetical protein